MKRFVWLFAVALLMVGCGEEASDHEAATPYEDDPSVPAAIPCVACGEKVSKKTTECRQCGHPTPDSIVAYKEAQERARRLAEAERKRQEELARIRAEEERQRLAAEKAEREKQLALYKAALKKIGEKPFTVPGLSMEMLWCAPGTFTMGSPANEAGRGSNETEHNVTLTQGFWLGKHEVTQNQYEAVMGTHPRSFKGENLPVTDVSWNDATSFCKKLTERERKAGRLPDGWEYALPTEAQWEYACRAGTKTAYSFGDAITKKQATFGRKKTSVGSNAANPWGFFDMHGNVWEWCADWYGTYPSGSVTDPTGPASGSSRGRSDVGAPRICRGGSWNNTGPYLRSAEREYSAPGSLSGSLGFRVGFKFTGQ